MGMGMPSNVDFRGIPFASFTSSSFDTMVSGFVYAESFLVLYFYPFTSLVAAALTQIIVELDYSPGTAHTQ
jgi:hypothetical protein